jgi:hypothetical protein
MTNFVFVTPLTCAPANAVTHGRADRQCGGKAKPPLMSLLL